MGYCARYHATSLIAVFIALAIGILIGAEFGGDALTNTRSDLEHSLVGNLEDARYQRRRPERGPDRPTSSPIRSIRCWPATTCWATASGSSRSAGCRANTGEVEEALAPTGGRLVAVGVVREPIDVTASPTTSRKPASPPSYRSRRADRTRDRPGRQLVLGGTLPEVVRGHLFSRASGNFGGLDGLIVVRDQPQDMGPVQRTTADVRSGPAERDYRHADPGGRGRDLGRGPVLHPLLPGERLSSVDDVELTAGQLAWSSPCSAPTAASGSRAAPTGCCRTC